MNHKLESKLLGEIIYNIGCVDDTTLMAESEADLELPDEGEREE